ncbi:DNA-binding storekeeper protein-related transcriptional regulator [Trifolium repens]|nr:DNA-binding storekeeper protein-related transcriptional regulator [Trifolium repens]
MAKKRQPTTTASKDDQPLTPASKTNKPPPSKKPEEDKVDDEEVISVNTSSSEGEEEGDDDDAEDDEEEESKNDEDKEDEEETDTDSDSDDETVPPSKLKSNDETLKSKPKPKSSAAPARSGTKRSAVVDTKQSKKKKTVAAADDYDEEKEKEVENKKSGDDSKKQFQRVFTEDDELAILKGLVDFNEEKGTDPLKYITAFYQEVKSSIHFPVTLDQLRDKIRRLKGKFETKMKSCKNGKTLTFSKPIEEEMFEFGKKIWGGGTVVEENEKPIEKLSKKEPAAKKPDFQIGRSSAAKENLGPSFIYTEMDKGISGVFGLSTDILKSGVELIEESKRVELERRWKELRVTELNCIAKRAELARDQARLILEVVQSSSSSD